MDGRRRWWALGAVNLSVLAVSLDGTVLSVALPTLARSLDASQADLVRFSAGYLLVLAAGVLPVGLLGDRIGRRKVMLGSLVAFGAGSAVCATAGSAGVFLAGRLLQGLAGAGITVMALSALVVLFDEHERRAAVGVYQAANFIALPLGPILGGWMLAHLWWGWVFLVNVPVVLVALVACLLFVPESRAAQRPGLDPVGTASSTAGLVLLVLGLVRAGEDGWGDPAALASLVAGAALLAVFVGWERRLGARPGGRPMVAPELLASRTFLWGGVLAAVAGLAMIGVLFTLPQFAQLVQGVDVLGSGLRLLPLIGGMVVGAVVADRLPGARTAVVAGFALLAAGLFLGAASTGLVATWTALVGAGTGLALTASTSAALAGLSAERSGTGSAVVQAFAKTSGPLGTAITGSVLVAGYRAQLDLAGVPADAAAAARRGLADALTTAARTGSPTLADAARTAFTAGLGVSLLVSGGVAVVGAVLAAVVLRGGRPGTRQDGRTGAKEVPHGAR